MRVLSLYACVLLPAFAGADVSLVSRQSHAGEMSRDLFQVFYDNAATFNGQGDWTGSLQHGQNYSNHADHTRIGGEFAARYQSWGEWRGFLQATTQSSMVTRFLTTNQTELHLDFSATIGPAMYGDTVGNAGLQIVSIETGNVVFDLFRDGISTYNYPYSRDWAQQSWSGVIGPGLYEVNSFARVIHTFGGGSGSYSGHGRLNFELNITPVPAPSMGLIVTCGLLCLGRRHRGSRHESC